MAGSGVPARPAYDPVIKEGLGLSPEDTIVGFMYFGTPDGPLKKFRPADPALFVEAWNGAPAHGE